MEEIIENSVETSGASDNEAENVSVKDNVSDVCAEEEKSSFKEEIARLREEGARQKAEYEAAVREMSIKTAALEKLYGEGARNPKLMLRLIDFSKADFGDDGAVLGLDEQIGALKEKEGYLFEEKRLSGSLGCFRPEESGDLAETKEDLSQMTYSEMIRALGR